MDERVVEKVQLGRTFLVRLIPGDDFFVVLRGVLKQERIDRAVIISGIGSFKQVVFRNLNTGADLPVSAEKTNEVSLQGPFEVLSLEGNVAPLDGEPAVHLHAILGTTDGGVIGGHLFKAVVFSTMEVVMATLEGTCVIRTKSALTGLTEITF